MRRRNADEEKRESAAQFSTREPSGNQLGITCDRGSKMPRGFRSYPGSIHVSIVVGNLCLSVGPAVDGSPCDRFSRGDHLLTDFLRCHNCRASSKPNAFADTVSLRGIGLRWSSCVCQSASSSVLALVDDAELCLASDGAAKHSAGHDEAHFGSGLCLFGIIENLVDTV